jgi:hypothetical protein
MSFLPDFAGSEGAENFVQYPRILRQIIGCGVAQIVAHRLAVRQARVRISDNEDNKSGTLRVV